MFKKIFLKSLLSIIFCFCFLSKNYNNSVVIQDQFGNFNYKIILFDLRPYITPLLVKSQPVQNNNILCLKEIKKQGNFFGVSLDATKFLNCDYDQRVGFSLNKALEFNRRNTRVMIKNRKGQEKNDKNHKIINRDEFDVPMVVKNNNEPIHERANLFDMFSSQVDEYRLSYGVGEWICHENYYGKERQFQITILGGICSEDGSFSNLGFFQYTYSPSTKCWYHRCFKPWTQYHLSSISNASSQFVLRNALSNFINKTIDRNDSLLLEKCFLFLPKQIDYYKTTLNLAIRACR